jgi:RNA polymerase sigma-70 factor (ECF subfamily)
VSQDLSFDALLRRLGADDPGAAAAVVDRFGQRLIGLAAGRLGPLLRPKAEPEDVVQSVFKSFFSRQRDGQFDLHGWDSLWDVLVVITLRKCCNRADYLRAARRDVRREVPLAAAEADPLVALTSREPTPEEAAVLAETVEQLLQGFRERDRAVLALTLQGFAVAEVSGQVGCSERKVYRVLERAREELQRMRQAGPEEPA